MTNAYCLKTQSAALTLRVLDFTQWKHYCAPWNLLGNTKYIRQFSRYAQMEYVRKCAKTRFELAPKTIQDKWLCEQFMVWKQIISARILLYPKFKQALMDSCGSPLCDPNDPVYNNALMSSRKNCVLKKMHLTFPMDRESHATDTWTGHTLIGPGTTEYNLCTLSGQLAVHRQLVSGIWVSQRKTYI